MAYNSIKASAPGSIMLFGEHAVLAGYKALAMAINQRINVTITPRDDQLININSDTLGQHSIALKHISPIKPFQFVLQTILHYQEKILTGLDINIQSDMEHTKGFGTSAAVTVACVAALEYLLNQSQDKHVIFLNSRKIIQQTQGRGSGTDALASTMGGIVSYVMEPLNYQVYPINLPISLIYCGYKTTTPEVIKIVDDLKKCAPEKVADIFKGMDKICRAAEELLMLPSPACGRGVGGEGILPQLGALMTKHQQYQKNLGVSDNTIETIITTCQQYPIHGAKITGSGLGDCIAILGNIDELNPIKINTDLLGVTIDVN